MENHGDFKISWDAYIPHFSVGNTLINNTLLIPSGEVNFSQLEREHEELSQVMTWVRIITNISIFMIIANVGYLLLMQILGVATNEIGHSLEQKETLRKQEETRAEQAERRKTK